MPKHIAIVLTNSVEGQEEEYNRWYTEHHIDEILGLDGHVAVQRFRLADRGNPTGAPYKYLAINEVAPGKLDAAVAATEAFGAEQSRAAESGGDRRFLPPAGLAADYQVLWFTAITDRREAETTGGWRG